MRCDDNWRSWIRVSVGYVSVLVASFFEKRVGLSVNVGWRVSGSVGVSLRVSVSVSVTLNMSLRVRDIASG